MTTTEDKKREQRIFRVLDVVLKSIPQCNRNSTGRPSGSSREKHKQGRGKKLKQRRRKPG